MADSYTAMLESTAGKSPFGDKAPAVPSPEKYVEKGEALLKQEQRDRQPLLDKQQANIDRMFEMAKELKSASPPKAPDLKDVPIAPDSQYKDPTQALGSMASVLAIFGSLKTRAPLTSALRSAAAAMKGFHQGDQERVKLEREKWHDSMEAGLKQNQIEMEKYTNALKAAQFDMEKARPMFETIAAENAHNTMLIATQQGDYKQMFSIYDQGVKIQEKMVDTYVKDQEFRLRQQDMRQRAAESAQLRRESLQLRRDQMEEKSSKAAQKAVDAGKPAERAVEVIGEMKAILETHSGVTGLAGMGKRPLESVLSMLGGEESGPAHQYESLARELQNILRQTEEFRYKGRTLAKEVADRDVMVRGLKFGDTGSISMDQLNHLENMLTGQGAGFSPPPGQAPAAPEPGAGIVFEGYRFPDQASLDKYKAAKGK